MNENGVGASISDSGFSSSWAAGSCWNAAEGGFVFGHSIHEEFSWGFNESQFEIISSSDLFDVPRKDLKQ